MSESPTATLTGVRAAALKTLRPLTMLFLGLGVVQIFLAGLGTFSLDGAKVGSADETAFDAHRALGMVLYLVSLLVLIAAAVARPNTRTVVQAGVLFVLVFAVQTVLAELGEDTPFFGGLHAIFGIGSLGVASAVLAGTRRSTERTQVTP
jgi:heme A synthase